MRRLREFSGFVAVLRKAFAQFAREDVDALAARDTPYQVARPCPL
jgi:hypothetical protein